MCGNGPTNFLPIIDAAGTRDLEVARITAGRDATERARPNGSLRRRVVLLVGVV